MQVTFVTYWRILIAAIITGVCLCVQDRGAARDNGYVAMFPVPMYQ